MPNLNPLVTFADLAAAHGASESGPEAAVDNLLRAATSANLRALLAEATAAPAEIQGPVTISGWYPTADEHVSAKVFFDRNRCVQVSVFSSQPLFHNAIEQELQSRAT